MKLLCVLIVAMLPLMACHLIIADDSSEKQGYLTVRTSDKIQESEDSKLTERCLNDGDDCDTGDDCCSGLCIFDEYFSYCDDSDPYYDDYDEYYY
uniref:Conopeptide Mi029 n=1 Tax=Conus miles TaxID=69564 RepID=A0A0E3SU31_CONMI|nr:conopeptide Mi029 [Conus miles]